MVVVESGESLPAKNGNALVGEGNAARGHDPGLLATATVPGRTSRPPSDTLTRHAPRMRYGENIKEYIELVLFLSIGIFHEFIGYTIAPSANSSIDYTGFRIGTRFCPNILYRQHTLSQCTH